MTRQITFRGKYSDKHGWVYGHYYNNCDCGVNQDIIVYHNIAEGTGTHSIINQKYLGQFTGLVDKNGKEIYEGDILRISRDIVYKARIVDTESHVCEVYYGTDGFWLKGRFHHRHITDWDTEAIGNIFENPELLK